MRRSGFHVRGDVGLHVAEDPAQGAGEQVLEDGVLPDVFSMAHGGEEDAALALLDVLELELALLDAQLRRLAAETR